MIKDEIIKALHRPLDPKNVSQHPFNGMDYIQAWHAIDEANRIFGFDGWSCETVYNKEVCRFEKEIGKKKDKGFCVGYEAMVRITALGVTREGTGHGSGIAKDLFDCIEGASKEAESDAMKRALKSFGNQFGLALYDKTKKNVKAPETVKTQWTDAISEAFKTIDTNMELTDYWNSKTEKLAKANKPTQNACEELYNAKKKELS